MGPAEVPGFAGATAVAWKPLSAALLALSTNECQKYRDAPRLFQAPCACAQGLSLTKPGFQRAPEAEDFQFDNHQRPIDALQARDHRPLAAAIIDP